MLTTTNTRIPNSEYFFLVIDKLPFSYNLTYLPLECLQTSKQVSKQGKDLAGTYMDYGGKTNGVLIVDS